MKNNSYIAFLEYAFSKMTDSAVFENPKFFWLLTALPLFIGWYIFRVKKDKAPVQFSSTGPFKKTHLYRYYRHGAFVLQMLAYTLLVIALARPQDQKNWQETKNKGIDIMITMDVSGSMRAEDFHPNRIEASKEIAKKFIKPRINDRIGLVLFGAESFTQCPLTIDHDRLAAFFSNVHLGMIDGDATAIGMGLATAVNRLKKSKAKSKVIILLTDGQNNAGEITPKNAAELAKEYGIRVYIIGLGSTGESKRNNRYGSFFNSYYSYGPQIDEPLMREMAALTGGQYFRAKSKASLKKIYKKIDKLEKSEISSLKFYNKTEISSPLILIGLVLFSISKLLKTRSINNIT